MKVSNTCKDQNGWIPVSLGFYPEDQEVVQATYLGFYDKKPRCDMLAFRVNDVWYYADAESDKVIVQITAWKHLCEPYRAKRSKVKVERRKKNELRTDKE